MNVASLKLCKELFELSGWEEDNFSPEWYTDENLVRIAPKYNLGYLLRMLPDPNLFHNSVDNSWTATNFKADGTGDDGAADANTPEDAVTLLAIELIKQSVLRPNTKSKRELGQAAKPALRRTGE